MPIYLALVELEELKVLGGMFRLNANILGFSPKAIVVQGGTIEGLNANILGFSPNRR